MSKMLPTGLSNAREYFSKELMEVMERRNVSAEHRESFEYLVNLLLDFMFSEAFYTKNVEGKLVHPALAQLYTEYLEGDEETKKQKLRRLGDLCLFITGIFPESLKTKIVDLDYYLGMGGTAYGMLSLLQISHITREVFAELSIKFREFSNVLAEMSERNGLQSDSDVLALYERWMETGDERLKGLLKEKGIQTPLNPKDRIKQ